MLKWLMVLVVVAMVIPVQGVLVVHDSDVSNSHYVYSLTYADMNQANSPLKFENDVWSKTNFSTTNESSSRYVNTTVGATTAELIYKFDFSGTHYRPTSLSLRDGFYLWDNGQEGATAVSSWSTDGVNYTPIRSGETIANWSGRTIVGGTVDIVLPANTPVVYYKFTVTVNPYDVDHVFTEWNQVNWNRQDSATDGSYFSADFTVVPTSEPPTSHYVYSLTYGDMNQANSPLKFENDVWTKGNFSTTNEGASGSRYVITKVGATAAELIYKFDFSETPYCPKSLSLRDNFNLWDGGEEGATAVSSWSTDGINYTTIHSGETIANWSGRTIVGGTVEITLPANTSVVYYKFRVDVNSYDKDGVFTEWNQVNWNRQDTANDGTYFSADFTVVPKPVTQAPTFSPAGPYLFKPTLINISAVAGTIYYTIDGTIPTTASPRYAEPVLVGNGTVLKAIAVGSDTSLVSSTKYTCNPARAANLARGQYLLIEKGLQLQTWGAPTLDGPLNLTNWNLSKFTTLNTCTVAYPNLASDMPAAPGMPWARILRTAISDLDIKDIELPYAPNLVSIQLDDEPALTSDYNAMAAERIQYLKIKHPDTIIHTDFTSAQDMSLVPAYMQTAKPDMLLFNNYPFNGILTRSSLNELYESMQKYRLLGLAGNDGTGTSPIPYGLYTQTYTGEGMSHVASESEVRLNEFSAWTFGYKFVSAFLYGDPQYLDTVTTLFTSPLQNYNNPTPQFYQVAETNRQSRNLGPALVRLLSIDVRMVMGQHKVLFINVDNSVPSGITSGIAGADSYLTGVSATNLGSKNSGLRGDVIVGFFKPLHESFDGDTYSNQKYFMVTNGLWDDSGSASDTRQQIRLTFNMGTTGITSLQRLSRNTGTIEIVPLTSEGNGVYHLDLVLDGGTGDLFKYNTGAPFVGVEEVQQPYLVISPETQTVAKEAGTASFAVSNAGTGTMAWTASVTSGGSWLTITSGSSGTNSGSIVVSFAKNTVLETLRTATIQIIADGASGSPRIVTLVQSAPELIPGDANKDGVVDVGDLGILAANYGGTNKNWSMGDFNNDTLVDVGDLGILAAHYGQGTANLSEADFGTDYSKAFGTTVAKDTQDDTPTSSSVCSGLGLPLIVGLAILGLMLVKLEE